MKKDNHVNKSLKDSIEEITGKKANDSEDDKLKVVEDFFEKRTGEAADIVDRHDVFLNGSKKESQKPKDAIVSCICLNVREKPTVASPIVGVVRKDEKLIVNHVNDGWASITTETGMDGYCMCDFIQS